ncbi:GNAT family N-acetyltransferase [Halostella salina]|uniref:GNAT family N-acetyltransferase n=1 Tax=Halostella salina TaxID=1547897 RepID=UPI000EF767DD|nr:GNAT family N-acetyltransferase [Halostella salina]
MGTRTGGACSAWDNTECQGTPYCPPRCPRFTDGEGVPLVVRPFRDSDRDAAVAMYDDIDSYSRTMGLPPATMPQIESWLDRLRENGWNLVALDGDRVVGHVAVVPADRPDPKFVVFIHQEYQDRGIGTELMKQVVAYADDRDHEALTLEVSKGNRRAVTVYENVGFEVVERMHSDLEMELSLEQPVAERVQRPPAERD